MRRGRKSLNGFKFGPFVGLFPSDGAASTAVKGLNCTLTFFMKRDDESAPTKGKELDPAAREPVWPSGKAVGW